MRRGLAVKGANGRPGKHWVGTVILGLAVVAGVVAVAPCQATEEAFADMRLGPGRILVQEDGKLLVLCENSGSLLRVDPRTGKITDRTALGDQPYDLVVHPDGRRLYVSLRRGQELLELDAARLEILRRFPLRGDPTGLAISGDGRRLYAGVHSLDRVAVFDLETGEEIARLSTGNGPSEIVAWPGRGTILFPTSCPIQPPSISRRPTRSP